MFLYVYSFCIVVVSGIFVNDFPEDFATPAGCNQGYFARRRSQNSTTPFRFSNREVSICGDGGIRTLGAFYSSPR